MTKYTEEQALNRRLAVRRYKEKHIRAFDAWKRTLFCEQCGENDPDCLDLHHINPKEKDYSFAVLRGKPMNERFFNEVAKCIVLCANCHRKLHGRLRRGEV